MSEPADIKACTKVRYESQAEARKALNKLLRFRAVHGEIDRLEQRAYRCGRCDGRWHLTSQSRGGR